MAEGYHQAHLRAGERPICDICKDKSDNQLKKCLDCDLYICDKCSRSHKEIPSLKKHTIISRVEREHKKILEISRTCSSHPNDEILYYCSTCKELICSECIIGIHKSHDCIKMKALAQQQRKKIQSELDKTKDIVIPLMESKLAGLSEKRKVNDEEKKKYFTNLKEKKLQMISKLEKINKELEAEYDTLVHQKNEDKILTTEANLNQALSEMKTMWSDFNKILHTGSELEVIKAEQELSEKLESINSCDKDTILNLPSFTGGKIDDKILKTMYGSLDCGAKMVHVTTDTDLEAIHQFKYKSKEVKSICPLTDNTALINYWKANDNDIVTVDGVVQQTLYFNFKVVDFIMTSQGDIMSTHTGSQKTIFKLTKTGRITDSMNTAPLKPVCLCESSDGNLLVSLVDELSYTMNNSSRRCVSRITMKGKVLESYDYNKGSRLFTWPWGVSENVNRDVCVVNRTSDTTGHVIILDSTGKLKSIYNGQQLKYDFNPLTVQCDKSGNIIVNDFINKTVHLLDIKGKFLRYIVTKNHTSDLPVSLAIDNKTGVLWVGGHEGKVYIFKYLK